MEEQNFVLLSTQLPEVASMDLKECNGIFATIQPRADGLSTLHDTINGMNHKKSKKSLSPDIGCKVQSRTYSFKKRKPLPGAYPRNFSPYTLECASNSRAVSLSHTEIKNDFLAIHQKMVCEFSSIYFEENATPGQESGVEVVFANPSMPSKPQQRVARRTTSTLMHAPQTEAEERRQIRAAIKASRLESARSAEIYSEKSCDEGTSALEWDTGRAFSPMEDKTCTRAASLLQQVCSGKIFRTG